MKSNGRVLVVWLTACWINMPGVIGAADLPEPSRMDSAYLLLSGAPVVQSASPAAKLSLTASADLVERSKRRGAALRAEQASLQARLEAGGARVTGHLTRLVNAIRVQVPEEKLGGLAALPGVKRVVKARQYRRSLVHSVSFIGASSVWSLPVPGVDGRGVRVGIIDSGIDYTHADFGGPGTVADYDQNDPTRTEPGTFPTAKVVGGYDFAGEEYDASNWAHSIPRPDRDPLDAREGHGTHVAGIVAGFGVLTNGQTYAGEYVDGLESEMFSVGPGVAPGAVLYALKVFSAQGTTDLVVDALEWAADPNQDYDFSDRLDVVNLSLGSTFGTQDPEDPDIVAVNALAQLGCIVVCSAGNDGNLFYAAGPPGSASRAIAVGNSIDKAEGPAIQVLSPPVIAGNYYALEGEFTAPLATTGPIVGRLVYIEPNDACDPLQNSAALAGNIALIDRGTCFFVDKIQQAQDAGAIAVIMVNHEEGDPIIMGGDTTSIKIPGVMISRLDGLALKACLDDQPQVRLDANMKVMRRERRDNLAGDSSRGPVGLASYLKPELVAPGSDITSAGSGTGHRGVSFTGTSMASPHVTGVAALLRQLHPAWEGEQIKAALMNSAIATHDEFYSPYPESWTGAGRVQADQAAELQVTAIADHSDGNVAMAFGSLVLAAAFETNRTVHLTNHGSNAVTFQVMVVPTVAQEGISLEPATNQVTVAAHDAAEVRFTFRADPARFNLVADPTTPLLVADLPRHFLGEASGQIWFQKANQTLRVPYYASVRAASAFNAASHHVNLAPELSAQTTVNVTLPISGSSVMTNAILSAFELGAEYPDPHLLSAYNAYASLRAVGVASDWVSAGSASNASIFFGLATAASWPTPQPTYVSLQIQIDTDNDGTADYRLSNGNATQTTLDAASGDVFLAVVEELHPNGSSPQAESGGFVNVFGADALDTAPFNNSVMVLPVYASQIGLSETQAHFRYRVTTYGLSMGVTETGWISFDPTRPAISTIGSGLAGTPMHPDGQPLVVQLDRAAAADSKQSMPGVLLLHHHNLEDRRFDVIRLDLSQDDQDYDGLPDWWEMKTLKHLAAGSKDTDYDGDGFSDRVEFLSGTDPADPASFLKLLSAELRPDQGIQLSWASAVGKQYTILRSEDLALNQWEVIAANQYATPPVNTYLDASALGQRARFYRLQLQ